MKKQIQSLIDTVKISTAPLIEKIDSLNEQKNKGLKLEAPEDSINIRIVSTLMAFLVITLACYYADISLPVTLFYLAITLIGSYLAYICRAKKNVLMIWTTGLGIFFVMGTFAQEIFFELYIGKLTPLIPFIQVVTGLQALHMLDLRTRADINTSIGVGLGLICCAAIIGKDIAFGIGVLIYISLAALLLYLQCISYSAEGVKRAASGRELFGENPIAKKPLRKATGSTFFMISTLPVASVFLFLNLPRIENLIDSISATVGGLQTPIQLNVTFPSGFAGSSGGSGPDGRGSATTSSFGSKPPENFKGTVQVKEDPNSKREIKLPASYKRVGRPIDQKGPKEETKTEAPPPENVQKAPQGHTFDDLTKEEGMSLRFEGKDVAAQNNELLMTIECSREVFLRRMCFDYFDGHDWTLTAGLDKQTVSANQDIFVAVTNCPAFRNDYLPGAQVHQKVVANAPLGHIVPVPWMPCGIKFPANKLSIDQNGIIRAADGNGIEADTSFETLSTVPVYNLDSMRGARLGEDEEKKCREALSVYLQLPPTTTDQVPLLARGLTRAQGTWFGKAETVASYLRSHFEYSLHVPAPDKSEDLVSHFLFKSKSGDCSHFASAFVVLMRSVGIPARVVGGYAPGARNVVSGKIEIHSSDAHAWAEVYIPRFGWIPFDAVPDGYLPGPRPDKSIVATIALSDPVKSVKDFVQSIVRSRNEAQPGRAGEGSGDSKGAADQPGGGEGGNDNKSKVGGQSGAKGNGAQGKDAQALEGKNGKGANSSAAEEEIARASQFGQNAANNSFKFSLQGLAGRARTFGDGIFGHEFSFKETRFDFEWFKRNWQPIAASIGMAPLLALLAFVVLNKLPLFGGRNKVNAAELKPSTVEFLKVLDDLSKLKFKKAVGQTPQEIVEQVSSLVANNPDEALKANLPALLEEFMDSYCSTRFAPEEPPEIGAELQQMGNKIHELVTSRPDSK